MARGLGGDGRPALPRGRHMTVVFLHPDLGLGGAERLVVDVDLIALAIPLARLAGRAPVVLYCHHPDRFLAPAGRGLYRWYRAPIDRLEAFGTAYAARVLVNSRYTATRVREAFPTLATEPDVIHPGVDVLPCPDLALDGTGAATILAMGRFDPRKNLVLAVEAFAALRGRLAT